jgi:pimeloyl-ACP methyl ester carboxylesterase
MGHVDRFVEVDGLKTRYLEAGNGPPLILMHGASLGSSAHVWDLNLDPLAAAGFRAIAYDDPGYGLSDDPPDTTVKHRRRFLPRFLDALGLESAHVIGHSQSGGVAVQVALDQSQRFTQLMIMGTASLVPPLPGQGPDEYGEGLDREPTIEQSIEDLKVHVFDVAAIPRELIEARHRMSVGHPFQAYLKRRAGPRMTTGDDNPPLWARLTELKMRFLMVYGLQDNRGAVGQRAQRFKEQSPGLQIELIDRCSHLIQWDQPQRFHELAVKFFT